MIRNDPVSICLLADSYHHGSGGLQQDRAKTMELYAKAAELGDSDAHCKLGKMYDEGGDLKKAVFHPRCGWTLSGKVQPWNNGGKFW